MNVGLGVWPILSETVEGEGEVDKAAGGRRVGGPGGWGEGSPEVFTHTGSKDRELGVGVGRGEASGASFRNSCM